MSLTRWKTLLLGVALLGSALLLTSRKSLDAQDKAVPADARDPFGAKVLIVYQKSKPSLEHALTIEGAFLVEMGKRPFLVGKMIGGGEPGNWSGGQPARICWDDVATIIEFENVAEYKRKFDAATNAKGDR